MKRTVHGRSLLLIGAFLLLYGVSSFAALTPYTELVPGFSRLKSNVMVRQIDMPTRAHLDYAAYDRNPLLIDPAPKNTGKKLRAPDRNELTFGGVVGDVCFTIGETPLTENEKAAPLAWKPLMKHLWAVVKDDNLSAKGARIAATKWGDDAVYQPFQEVATAYLHDNEGDVEVWVKIECAPWASVFKAISDEDRDGVREFYGRLAGTPAHPDSLAKAVDWIRREYCTVVLDHDAAIDWVTDLASYWYPTRNTDIIPLDNGVTWPDASVKKQIRREVAPLTVSNPLAVVEGKPLSPDKPVYNIYVIPEKQAAPVPTTISGSANKYSAAATAELSASRRLNDKRFNDEVCRFGSYAHWAASLQPFYAALSPWKDAFPQEQMALPGTDGWLFFRKSFDALCGGDIGMQPDSLNPLVHIAAFNNYLKNMNVELLFVAVPDKEEVYYDKISHGIPTPHSPIVKPFGRKFLAALQQQGVEVIDLLSPFLEAKMRDSAAGEAVYQKQDTHWTNRGLQIAADEIAGRIRLYPWYHSSTDTVAYRYHDTLIERAGDIAGRLPPEVQGNYLPVKMTATRIVQPDGSAFQPNEPDAPVLLIGDSFTGVFELIDCKSAGVGAHIAARTRLPVDIITSWGGGPMVRQKMLRARGSVLNKKRVVIYMMVARDLYRYEQGWEPIAPVQTGR